MMFLNSTTFRSSFFKKDYLGSYIPIFSDIVGQFLWLCLLSSYRGLWLIYSSNFWKLFSFLLCFSSISKNNFRIFLTETGDFSCNSSDALLHFRYPNRKWWVFQRINVFKLTGMVYYNYIQFLPIFSTSWSPFIIQV